MHNRRVDVRRAGVVTGAALSIPGRNMTRTVLHLIHMTGPGGAETVVLNLALGMQNHRWRSKVLLPERGWLGEALSAHGVDPIIVPDHQRARYLAGIISTVRRHRVDLIHAHLLGPASYASIAGLACKIPVVCTFHGHTDIQPDSIRERVRTALIGRAARRVVLVSDALKELAAAQGRYSDATLAVITNGIDLQAFQPRAGGKLRAELGVPADAFLVGAVGNLRPAKDYPTLLRAAAELVRRSGRYHFVIAGETSEPLYSELLRLRDELGLGDRLRFLGFRPDVPEIFNDLDALVLSSRAEGFSLVTIQAMASGVPVIATRCGGPERIIDDRVDGLLVPVGDGNAIAASVELVRVNASLRAELVEHGLEKVRRSYSVERTLASYEEVYDHALSTAA